MKPYFWCCIMACLLPHTLVAREMSEAELENWFLSNELLPDTEKTNSVNEGRLEFLIQPPSKPVHHHHNTIVITAQSLKDGWVKLQQCHTNLDPVPRSEIIFNRERVKNLRIERSQHIGKAWVEVNSVQLEDVERDAEICLSASSRALQTLPEGGYMLSNGPFMRRFLDGYYPMHVTMDVHYDGSGLEIVSVSPDAQQGFVIRSKAERLNVDAWFEGRLKTQIHFR